MPLDRSQVKSDELGTYSLRKKFFLVKIWFFEIVLTNTYLLFNFLAAFDLPDHLMHWQTIWKKPRTASPLTSYKKSGGPWSPFARSTSSIIRQDPLGPNGGSGANRSRAASRMGPPYPSGISLDKSRQGSLAVCNSGGAPLLDEPATNHSRFSNNTKEKFNFIEEFFICLACIFD